VAYIASEVLSVTTDGSGAATATTLNTYNGLVQAIVYTIDGTSPYANGVVITVTGAKSGLTLWSETLATNASKTRYPRAATQATDGTAALYASAGTAVLDKIPLADEGIKVVIASGGATKVGSFRFLVGG
jgi:hypothetical protein